ncbi:hypothetical protein DSO57_1008642 [Entomophthora muscae]|uniref:Uncharacterized protein n=1 Tax=Entomophthora muscae TaxID=34485 RepID=A0ACC2TVL5_9FUNG|nr:hypothetical protein DSO57_1008642 [Entomophthora muscae]
MRSIKTLARVEKEPPTDKFLENVIVTTFDGAPVLLSNLWKDRDVVLKVLPRIGCRLCKYEARSLGNLRIMCDTKKVALAAVCFADPDLETFLADGYWNWDIFLDPEREVYKRARLHRLTWWQVVKDVLSRRFYDMNRFIEDKFAYSNKLKGDRYQLGGTFVIGKGGKMLFQFRPSRLAMYPSLKEIYTCLGGDPEDIEEVTPLESVFSQEKATLLYRNRSTPSLSPTLRMP